MASEGAERRLAAILSADVVGYSRLMAEDEDDTVDRLTAYRDQIGSLVTDHRGRVVDFTGDNLLAEFPAALDAVQCAVEIQRALKGSNAELPDERRMEFRTGVHLGDIRVEEGRIYGDGVNIAARLEGLAEPGGIYISGTVHEQVRHKLALAYEDLGEQQVKNIPDPVRVIRVEIDGPGGEGPRRARRGRGRLQRAVVATGVSVLLIGVVIALSWRLALGLMIDRIGLSGPPESPPLPDEPSIAVLPFTNMSADPEQEYFSDGITEDLTAALSKVQGLFVISRHSAFTYKGQSFKVEDVGRELGVRYVLEGSVRKAGQRVRITAQLVDASTGFHIWGETYDRDVADIFAVQSEVSGEILRALGVEIKDAELERIRGKPTQDLTAYDLMTRGAYHLEKYTRKDNEEARRLFGQAIERDPELAEAYALIGVTYALELGMGWNFEPELMDRAEEYTRRSLELTTSSSAAHITLATVQLFRGRTSEAIEVAKGAVEMDPNEDTAHMVLGSALLQAGSYVDALREVQMALRLNPRAPTMTWVVMGYANALVGREEEATRLWQRVVDANPDMIMARVPLASAAWDRGQHEESREHVREILRVSPHITVEQAVRLIQGRASVMGTAQIAEIAANLRKAGLPE
jgi:adenylate cyclase